MMTDEEIKDKLRKMLFLTQRANECGLSNNDFKEDIDTLSGALGLLDKKDKVIGELKTINKIQDIALELAINQFFGHIILTGNYLDVEETKRCFLDRAKYLEKVEGKNEL